MLPTAKSPSCLAAPLNEDLEDGEIFDDDEEDIAPIQKAPVQQSAVATEPPVASSPVPSKKRPLSPTGSDRRRPPRQRRTKRGREDDRPFPRKQRRRSEEHEKNREKEIMIDEDELLNVTRIRSPPPGARTNNDWDRFHGRSDEEDEEGIGSSGGGGGGGGGGVSGGSSRRNNRGRDGFQSRRRVRTRGGGRRGGGRRSDSNICKFYLQGKCQRVRGPDCPYAHANSQRKFELCKFYMNDCCAKKDKCLFMHSDFPCKFFHLGLKCYAGKRCKFSHSKVSSFVKQQLIKHNQSESDKHFLHNLETFSPRESPTHDHMDGGGDSPSHHHHRRGGQNHHNRHQSGGGSRHHSHQDVRRSISPPHSDHNEELNCELDVPLQNNPDSSYSDDERNRTPMPSPSQENSSDRDMKSPEREMLGECSSNSDTPASDQKDSGFGEEMPQEVPLNLPRKQRELYLRIQQQQRHTQEEQNDEEEERGKEEDYKDEDWYSSDEEGNVAPPLATILKTIKDKRSESNQEQTVPELFPDFDVKAVSKLLSTVRETIQQKQQQQPHSPLSQKSNSQHSSHESKSSQEVKRRVRDPRLRAVGSPPIERRIPNDFMPSLPPLTNPLGADLRYTHKSTITPLSLTSDVDLRQLPFKPAPVHQAANEIDASITSHPPIANYALVPFPSVAKPDYSHVQPKNINDPRLKRFVAQPLQPMSLPLPALMGNSATSGHAPTPAATRDPRQRVLANDPRRRPLLPHPPGPLMGHHVSNPRDSELMGHPPFPLGNDVDLRFQQPAPNFSYD
ncbi:uncharacterized protein isoform X3 [Rhodnius prolixus]|uniref:uncharacterized protein isoform X3 n=1 Tax=Rhodnius prolixus TaxID=13249 RepID=UPI003D18F824